MALQHVGKQRITHGEQRQGMQRALAVVVRRGILSQKNFIKRAVLRGEDLHKRSGFFQQKRRFLFIIGNLRSVGRQIILAVGMMPLDAFSRQGTFAADIV